MNRKIDWDELVEMAMQIGAPNPIFKYACGVYRDIVVTGDPDAPCGICGRKDFHFHDETS